MKKALVTMLASMGVTGIFLGFAFMAFMMSMMFYGLYLAFSASLILGIIVFIVEPSPLIIGLVMFFFDKNLAQMLLDFLNK